jgi:hypothetical protein
MDTKVWIEVGEVTGSSGAKESIDGVEYDMVLPVEMETTQGLHTFQLGYNNGENPFVAAQRFLDTNGIDQSYHSQIADWIIARQGQSSQPTIDMSGGSSTGDNTTGIFTYICTHKYALIQIHPYTLIHTHTYSYILIHAHTYAYKRIHAHTCSYTAAGNGMSLAMMHPPPKYTYLPVTALVSFDILIHTHTYSYILIHTHTYLYMLIHTHTNVYMRIHAHTQQQVMGCPLL